MFLNNFIIKYASSINKLYEVFLLSRIWELQLHVNKISMKYMEVCYIARHLLLFSTIQ